MNKVDIQIIAKIASNCGEIASVVGFNSLLGAAAAAINRYHPYTKKLLFWGIISLAVGTASPVLILECAKMNELAAGVVGLVTASVLMFGSIWCFFLPMKIAKQRNHAHLKAIVGLNLLLLVPFTWLLALWWATIPQRKLITNPEFFSPAVLAICERADETLKMLDEAGFKKASKRLRMALVKDVEGDKLLLRLTQVLDRLMFDFELPDAIADNLRSLSEEIHAAQ
jgi:hypothetical protein